jgi:hypothetical protein
MSFPIILAQFIINMLFDNAQFDGVILFNLQTRNTTSKVVLRSLLYLVPSVPFNLLYLSIQKLAGKHMNNTDYMWVEGTEFTWNDFFSPSTIDKSLDLTYYQFPPPYEFFLVLLQDCAFYMVLLWYFDHIIAHNRGAADPFYFFLQKKYWMSFLGDT